MEVAVSKSLPQTASDDVAWPTRDDPVPATSNPSRAYWHDVASRHTLSAATPTEYRPLTNLPSSWGVVSLHLAVDEGSLYLVRHGTGTPLVVRLPLDRQGRREGEEDLFSYEVAAGELQAIIKASNEGAQRAKFVTGHNAKALWWAERKELDARLKSLLESVEERWLGGCKVRRFPRDGWSRGLTTVNSRASCIDDLLPPRPFPSEPSSNRSSFDI